MPQRIAHIVEAAEGGVARHVIDLVRGLDPVAFTSLIYVSLERPESWRDRFRALKDEGITVREIPMANLFNGDTVRRLAGWARRDAVDLLHLHSAKAGYLGRKAAAQAGLPVVYTPHAFPFQRATDPLRGLYRMVERGMADAAARIICVSEGEAQEALDAGLPEERLVIVPNGLDLNYWRRPTREQRRAARAALGLAEGDVVVGAMARCVPQKGLDLLLTAAEDFLPDYPASHVLIWGDGPQRRGLEKMAARLRLPRVRFLGAARDAYSAFAAMDIFVAPSRWEAGPYAVLEAMACALPVVATDVPGNADYVVHDETGLLTPADLPGPIAGALHPLLADLDLRAAYGDAGRKRVETTFTLEQMVGETMAVYREVLAEEQTEQTRRAEEDDTAA
jgi:glycosyltransferase involved in cell wall biosynthesis